MAASSLAATPSLRQAGRWLGGLPPRFEPNLGQRRPEVRFAARFSNYSAEFRAGEVRIVLPGARRSVSLVLEGASRAARIEGEGRLASTGNYLLGNQPEKWRTGVPQYRSVRYRGIYPGVDGLFYAAEGSMEYDFELAPGADPSRIRLRFSGADSLRLTPQGHLEVMAGGQRLIQKKPLAYQPEGGRRRAVECRYRLAGGGRVSLELGPYQRNRPLVIDPVLVYATYLGAATTDTIVALKVDAQGMIYVTGYTDSGDLATTPDSFQTASAGARDIFVAKLDPTREGADSLVYFTYLGGSEADTPTAMALDAAGAVYLTGWTRSRDFPLGGNAPQIQRGGDTGQDAFVVKLNPSIPGPAGLFFSTYWGGEGLDAGYGIDVDQQGLIYLAGVTKSDEFPLTQRPIQRGLWGSQDGFIVWLDPDAPDPTSAVLYSSYLGGEFSDEARAVAALGRGLVAVAGATFSETFHVTGNGVLTNYQGGGDTFVTVLDMNKPEYDGLVYSTYLGGTGNDEPRRMTRDAQGRLVVTGYTLSTDFPVTEGAFQSAARRIGQVFVTILDPRQDGRSGLVYSTYFGGTGGEVAYDVALDGAGRIYLTGYTLSRDFPVTAQAFQRQPGEGVAAFCTVLAPTAPPERALVYSTYLGRTGVNVGYGIAVSAEGVIHVGGWVQDRAFPVSPGALQSSHGGGVADAFVIVLKPDETGLSAKP